MGVNSKHLCTTTPVQIHAADSISILPDQILHHILSFLPTRDAVRTRVLSKTWHRISTSFRNSSSFPLSDFVEEVLVSFHDPEFLQSNCFNIICSLLQSFKAVDVVSIFASSIVKHGCSKITSSVIQVLNEILVSSPQLLEVREELGTLNETMFSTLFDAWSYSAVSAVSICLLSQKYKLAASLITAAATELAGEMKHLKKLIEAFEGEAFVQLRMQLINSHSHQFSSLIRVLYSLLMIVPMKTKAFKILKSQLAIMEKARSNNVLGIDEEDPEGGGEDPKEDMV